MTIKENTEAMFMSLLYVLQLLKSIHHNSIELSLKSGFCDSNKHFSYHDTIYSDKTGL